jgi:hypothetical protein
MNTTEKNEEKKCDCCTEEYWEKNFDKDFEKKTEKFFEKLSNCDFGKRDHKHEMGGGFYFLAMIGAVIYFVQQVSGFWPIVLAILKAFVWPSFLLYEIFVRLAI